MYLFRAIYYSRNRIKDAGLSPAKEIKAIATDCVRNNPSAGLTGALIFNDHYFAQVLEGDRKQVSTALWRIAGDPRNSEPILLAGEAVTERRFPNWSMAFAGHSEAIDRLYLRYGIAIGLDPARMSAHSLMGLIDDLVRTETRVMHTNIEPKVVAAV